MRPSGKVMVLDSLKKQEARYCLAALEVSEGALAAGPSSISVGKTHGNISMLNNDAVFLEPMGEYKIK